MAVEGWRRGLFKGCCRRDMVDEEFFGRISERGNGCENCGKRKAEVLAFINLYYCVGGRV